MNACTNCLTLENETCLLGDKCVKYDEDSINAEIRRRKLMMAAALEKRAARLRKEAEEPHGNH
jgi:hypothetical protein